MKLTGKDILTIVIALAALLGVAGMFMAEGAILLDVPAGASLEEVRAEFNRTVLPGLVQYSLALGLMLLVISLAYMLLVGREEDLITSPDESEKS